MLVTSGSGAEYRAMSGLTARELATDSVLDRCAGGASIVAGRAAERAAERTSDAPVVAVIRPAADPRDLADRVEAAPRDGDRTIASHADRSERRRAMRRMAARPFPNDLGAHPNRYMAAALPQLSFADAPFDLVARSQALFTWSDRPDAAWRRATLDELVHVCRREVRISPLAVQEQVDPSTFWRSRVPSPRGGPLHRTLTGSLPLPASCLRDAIVETERM